MHADTGQRALGLGGLEDAFRRLARYEDQGGKVYHPDGRLLFEDDHFDGDRPEIDRTQLRQLLLDALPDAAVRWDQKVQAVRPLADGRHAVAVDGRPDEAFDLVVGADGAWSRVRPLVSEAVPYYEGVTIVELGMDDADARHPEIAGLVGHGKIFIKAASKTLGAQRSSNGHIRVYAALRAPETPFTLDLTAPHRAKAELIAHFAEFAQNLLHMIATGELIAVRPMYALPIGHRWVNRPGLTLIGDAAHLMSPFGGEGANLAMADGADLAMALVQDSDWRQAVADYEAIMAPRAEEAARGAAEGLSSAVSEDARDYVLEHFEAIKAARDEAAWLGHKNTPKVLFETRIAGITQNSDAQRAVNGAYRFDLSGPNGGNWIVDFKPNTAGVRQADEAAECTIAMTDENFVAMIEGQFSPRTAFMSGKLKFKGNMGLAMRLGKILASQPPA
jgi:2-polyprenyl-6-methoxyphenol hydroxylase-like FAD-dependent oxidoreductase